MAAHRDHRSGRGYHRNAVDPVGLPRGSVLRIAPVEIGQSAGGGRLAAGLVRGPRDGAVEGDPAVVPDEARTVGRACESSGRSTRFQTRGCAPTPVLMAPTSARAPSQTPLLMFRTPRTETRYEAASNERPRECFATLGFAAVGVPRLPSCYRQFPQRPHRNYNRFTLQSRKKTAGSRARASSRPSIGGEG